MNDPIDRLRAVNAAVAVRDFPLGEEMQRQRDALVAERAVADTETIGPQAPTIEVAGQQVNQFDFAQETIVMRTGRPVLAIARDEAQLIIDDPDSQVWKERLTAASAHLTKAARAVGRIEVEGHALAWLGTGWLVSPELIITNRHVAAEFTAQDGSSFVFKQGLGGGAMTASIDFLEEIDRPQELTFQLDGVRYVEGPDGPDLAFIHVSPAGEQPLAAPIDLAADAVEDDLVAVIGYPARDSRIPDLDLMDRIFGNVYNKKRLAPGQLTGLDASSVRHDCSTLGGNSGSVVLSLVSGSAVGLHFAGRFLQANFAVPSAMIRDRLDKILRGARQPRPAVGKVEDRPTVVPQVASRIGPAPAPAGNGGATKFSFVIPLQVTVEVGNAHPVTEVGSLGTTSSAPPSQLVDDKDAVFTEAVPADYLNRMGYAAEFLGNNAFAPMPTVVGRQDDVFNFQVDGREEHVLRYEHFSVVMSRSRRLCLFSAVNIDGLQSGSATRTNWRTDPRIPPHAQIRDECYGSEPKFSRGHMTRREDPVWGDEPAAARGNSDSMHVTNAVPQMQPFNAGIWLGLENYALKHARDDDMKISVFTGPILENDDPIKFGVQIPVEFWKVIVFVHDTTGNLCATGYTMSQEAFLSENEFVFGEHKTAQCSITLIERRTGLTFGALTDVDPFKDREGLTTPELATLSDIQFI